ncbi:MAG: four helix bundle protein [Desulfobacteraceae bacterium]
MPSKKSTSYRDLEVWQKAILLAKVIYELTDKFPSREIYGLSNQLRRGAVSIASNIAEGQAHSSRKEFQYFLNISLGSIAELETQLTIAQAVAYMSEEALEKLLSPSDELTRMIKGLLKHLAGQ